MAYPIIFEDVMESEDDASQLEDIVDKLSSPPKDLSLPIDPDSITSLVSSGTKELQHSQQFTIHGSLCSWEQHLPVFSVLIIGHLHAEYEKLSGLLSLPPCSSTQ